ncbi:MAG TPA: S1/P1 nuclease [Thermoanaerobaculia bacterium]|jgi:hypothetical protein|nr:S1/P1 nuclease [Thermoanaerobaculia bacterium]
MAHEPTASPSTREGTTEAQGLVETLLTQLRALGTGEESSRFFPNGIQSIDLEVGLQGTERRIALKVTGGFIPGGSVVGVAEVAEEEEDAFELFFNTEGHHVIAAIAKRDLESRFPDAWQRVQEILDAGDRTVEEAATFPDDIRSQHPETKPFHFIDIPFEDGGPVNPPLPGPPHVLSKIDEFTDFLRGGAGTDQEKVDALSWLFHLFGDVHQPLHCIEHISELHPGGDRGGNSFKLKGRAKNLHSLWDSSVNVSSPKDQDELVEEIMQEHSRESLDSDLQITDSEKWARASYNLAKRSAYSLEENPQNPPKPPASYLRNMEKIGHRQAALGGYRLSDRLLNLFGS